MKCQTRISRFANFSSLYRTGHGGAVVPPEVQVARFGGRECARPHQRLLRRRRRGGGGGGATQEARLGGDLQVVEPKPAHQRLLRLLLRRRRGGGATQEARLGGDLQARGGAEASRCVRALHPWHVRFCSTDRFKFVSTQVRVDPPRCVFPQSSRRSCSGVLSTNQNREHSLIRVTFEVGATLSIEWAPVTLRAPVF
jgi:hypothetical protein